MEKGHQYSWMWSKRNRHEYAGVDDSWEEQAFAEDAAGLLGGCVWPPRSYTCSFCRREFRSAQALGGHMNVHRRDRARLKQFPNAQSEILNQQHNNNQGYESNNNHLPCSAASSMGIVKYPPQNCALSNYNPNPNSQCYSVSDASTAPAAVRFSSQSQEITTINNKVMVPPRNNYVHSPTAGANGNKASSLSLAPTSQSSKVVAHDQNTTTCVVNQQDHHQRRYNSRNDYIVALDSMRGNEEDDHVRSDLSISLSLILRKNHPMSKSDDDPNVEAAGNSTCGCKKRKLDISSSSPPIFIDHVQPTSFSLGNMLSEAAADAKDVNSSEMHKIKYRSKVELDLELRLGNGST